jgi:hypothetical protein
MFQTKVVEEVKTHIYFSINFFFENRSAYDKMWKKYGRSIQATDDNIMYRMGFTCRLTKATDTLIMYNNYCFLRQKLLRERA